MWRDVAPSFIVIATSARTFGAWSLVHTQTFACRSLTFRQIFESHYREAKWMNEFVYSDSQNCVWNDADVFGFVTLWTCWLFQNVKGLLRHKSSKDNYFSLFDVTQNSFCHRQPPPIWTLIFSSNVSICHRKVKSVRSTKSRWYIDTRLPSRLYNENISFAERNFVHIPKSIGWSASKNKSATQWNIESIT
jgi:hypothetical protein